MQAAVFNLATTQQVTTACVYATAMADNYLANRYAMPLLSWPADLTFHTALIAAWYLVRILLGVAPQAGSDDVYDLMRITAIGGTRSEPNAHRQEGYFEKLQRQALVLACTPSLPVGGNPGNDAPQVSSQPVRGWQQVVNGRSVVGGF